MVTVVDELLPRRTRTRRAVPRDRLTLRINLDLVMAEAKRDGRLDGVQPDVSHTVRVLIGEAIDARLAVRAERSALRRGVPLAEPGVSVVALLTDPTHTP